MKQIRIFARQVRTDKGLVFLKFSFTKDGEKFYDVKFNKTCELIPQGQGYWLLDLESINMNIQKVKKSKDSKFIPNDVLWIKKVSKCVKDEAHEKEVEENRRAEIEAILG